MTKTQKAEVYKKYEQGNGALASPEVEIKEIEKQERRKARAQEKRIKHIAQKTLIEEQTKIAKLEQTIAELRAEVAYLKSLKDLNSDIPEEDKDFVIEYDDLDKYFPDGIDQDDPKHQELMKHFSEHCKMRLDYEFDKERKAMEDKPMTEDEAEAQISSCQRLLESGELEDDDIPSEEEQLAQRKTILSYRLQEFHDKGYLQASEAERLRQCSIYADELPKIKDNGTTQADTSHNLAARKTICNYIKSNKVEFGLDFDKLEDLDTIH